MNKATLLILSIIIISGSVGISYAVQEVTISRDSYSEDNYLLFEDSDGTDQFWVDGDGFAFHNGTQIELDIHNISNVTSFGCATDQILKVSGSSWVCAADGGGGGGGFSTVYKTADETINNDDVLTDDADLQFSVDANGIYAIIAFIEVDTGATPDYKDAFSVPSGTNGLRNSDYLTADGTGGSTSISASQNKANVNTLDEIIPIRAIVRVDTTSGTIAYQWAQKTSSATNTILKEGSWLAYKKLN